MDKKSSGAIKYRYLAAVLFILAVFACTALNAKEVLQHYMDGTTRGIRALAEDAESVDAIVYPFVNLNGAFQGMMQRDYIYDANPANDTIRKKSGYIVSNPSGYSDEDVAAAAENLKASADWLAAYDIPLVYIQVPSKMSLSPDEAMPGIPNHTYARNTLFREKAEALGINYVDANQWLTGTDADFYITDHHWTTTASFDATRGICEYLNENYDMGLDTGILDEDNYEMITHKNAFLGAEGRRTGIWYVGLDDFVEIIPDFETDFSINISHKDLDRTEREGDFKTAVMDTSKDAAHYSFEDSAYYEYWGGDYGRVHVVNNMNKNGRKIMVFKDSYGIPVTAFMTNLFEEMEIMDIRYYNDEKSIKEIIAEERPDAVLYVYGTGYLSKPKMFAIK